MAVIAKSNVLAEAVEAEVLVTATIIVINSSSISSNIISSSNSSKIYFNNNISIFLQFWVRY